MVSNTIFVTLTVTFLLGPPLLSAWHFSNNLWLKIFWTLFCLRYVRLFGHISGYLLYKPFDMPPKDGVTDEILSNMDVTVILPVAEPERNKDLCKCLESVLDKQPKAFFLVTTTDAKEDYCRALMRQIISPDHPTEWQVSNTGIPSKRRQVTSAVVKVTTKVIVTVDDHVWWPSKKFFPSLLAPFIDPEIVMVGTRKKVQRTTPGIWTWPSVLNFFGCTYLERHNWDMRASSTVDGGLAIISGRTAAYRTDFFQDADLLQRFCHEKFFFGLLGGDGLGPDDDNFMTREAIRKGKKVFFQDTYEATIWTTVGDEGPTKLRGQLIRWARTTFRSNPVLLRDPKVLRTQPWSWFMVYWAWITNFALVWDGLLLWSFCRSVASVREECVGIWVLTCWVLSTKMIKILPHFTRCPEDLVLFPAQVVFAYVHSVLKLWALLTFWDCGWAGR